MKINMLTLPPSETEADSWLTVLASAAAADLPQLPAPSRTEIAGRLRVPSARGRAVLWAAEEGAGVAALVLFSDEANRHTAFVDVLAVPPRSRRRGVGTALWERIREELLADGRTSVEAMVDLGGPGQAFAESLGFVKVLPMAWYEQQLPDRPAPVPATPGYEILTWHGLVPEAWAPSAAAAHGAMEDAPSGDMDMQLEPWTAPRLHSVQQLILDRGGELTTVAAVTPEGEVGAYTELVLPDPSGTRALQYDTVVTPRHRGHGLGRAVKLHMAAHAAGRYPALRRIATTVADENAPMRRVNEALGYRRERGTAHFQLKL
ncbi:GNAT family N-acetyltransferase [Streptomyces sp. MB09-01]|uniref:GNAT family N-acetyltransferase n=1 Tax=Streptomyces sp. MB09-01 TaxID=3028666 RepID=UPI0029A65488|nr:GNAT family N-acetyltransferase [Streptomyces sp. MB09-01]MDX3538330.1 GNAT family N-acetyltransferase [Streptomyces sp. MB09-01]